MIYRNVIKRLLDLVGAIICLIPLGIIVAVVALLIKREDGGPVFYNAPRVGRGGRMFTMYKFRSMQVDAPDLKEADGSTFNAADDPRQTRVGAVLRRTSIDELPQIINVLLGNMSFIGPRPDLAEEAALYQGDEARKLEVTPGISGYAQVYGRNAIAWRERLALDVIYVDKISFALDTRIFFRTFAVALKQEGVYNEPKD